MVSGSLDLRSLVDGLSHDELDELRHAVASRLCRERYGADTIEGLLAKWGHEPKPRGVCGRAIDRLDTFLLDTIVEVTDFADRRFSANP